MRRLALVLVAAALVMTGCAGTRTAHVGLLPGRDRLVTLVVTEDLQVVRRECFNVPRTGAVLGCQIAHATSLPGGDAVTLVKIVRYTDALPSPAAFLRDAHQLCRTLAALQALATPCRAEDDTALIPARSPEVAIRTP
jgi:hypothetical protein